MNRLSNGRQKNCWFAQNGRLAREQINQLGKGRERMSGVTQELRNFDILWVREKKVRAYYPNRFYRECGLRKLGSGGRKIAGLPKTEGLWGNKLIHWVKGEIECPVLPRNLGILIYCG
ncbi:MAG: hypothetical protein PHS82_04555 [Lachnospiraceae bacterium]|nr:hypothetical protein [Lachnospiraceae bacterium]